MKDGYGFAGSDEQIEKWVLEEFSQSLENPIVHCLLHPLDHQRVGTLLILGRPTHPSSQDSRFSRFWNSVLSVDPELGQQTDGELRALEIGGVFIAKDNPNRGPGGDADTLLLGAIKHYKPQAIVGVTCSPNAIRWRLRVVSPLGFRTQIGDQYFGDSWNPELVDIADSLIQGYMPLHGKKGEKGSVIVDREYLEPQKEIKVPKNPDSAFYIAQALWLQQRMLADDETAATIALSVHPQLHLRTPEEQFF